MIAPVTKANFKTNSFPAPANIFTTSEKVFEQEFESFMKIAAGRSTSALNVFGNSDLTMDAVVLFLGSKGRSAGFEKLPFWIEESGEDFTKVIQGLLKDCASKFADEHNLYFTPLGNVGILLRHLDKIVGFVTYGQLTSEKYLSVIGAEQFVRPIFNYFQEKVILTLPNVVRRLQVGNTGAVMSVQKRVKDKSPIRNPRAFFPSLSQTPEELYRDFEASDANVLIIYGKAGLGKSQLIRELCKLKNVDDGEIYLADTADIFEHPGLVPFIHGRKDGSWFITEDSTVMVEKRESGNSLMAGILNATEGLTSGNVKFIISTNLEKLNDVDTALIRPGRTFRCIPFKPFTVEQGNAAREAIGLEPIQFVGKEYVTLAEALNWEEYLDIANQTQRVGF